MARGRLRVIRSGATLRTLSLVSTRNRSVLNVSEHCNIYFVWSSERCAASGRRSLAIQDLASPLRSSLPQQPVHQTGPVQAAQSSNEGNNSHLGFT
jgi:hypothetical protein